MSLAGINRMITVIPIYRDKSVHFSSISISEKAQKYC